MVGIFPYVIATISSYSVAATPPPPLLSVQNSQAFSRIIANIVHPSGRVVEVYSPEFFGTDVETKNRWDKQMAQDAANDLYTPRLNSTITEQTPLSPENIVLGPLIHAGHYSTVYNIVGHPDLIIKYEVHCNELDEKLHPILTDGWYTSDANAFGLAPSVRFISPPSLLCDEIEGKCAFEITREHYDDCKRKDGTLRYMIMDRVTGYSLHDYRSLFYQKQNGAMSFVDAVSIGAHLINVIRRLHVEAKILHGDIHSPNIMLTPINGGSNQTRIHLTLIDFERAIRIGQEPLPEEPTFSYGRLFHEYYTHWQMDGFEWAPRDDVLKAIQTIAQLMHPMSYLEMEASKCRRGYIVLKVWKCVSNWFIPDPANDPVAHLAIPEGNKAIIRANLETILKATRSLTINGPIPYFELIQLFIECAKLADGTRRKTTMVVSNPTKTPMS